MRYPAYLTALLLFMNSCATLDTGSGSSQDAEGGAASARAVDTALWDEAVKAFEEVDRAQPVRPGGVVFAGSSTIVGWDLARHFPGIPALNRGFGGSQYADLVHYADRVILPYQPSTVVLYSGDNDIAAGKSPEEVFGDFQSLIRILRRHLPEARIIVLSIKPSKSRWNLWGPMQETNALIGGLAREAAYVSYLDIASSLLGSDGVPRDDLYQEDALHLNDRGYQVCTSMLRPLLAR